MRALLLAVVVLSGCATTRQLADVETARRIDATATKGESLILEDRVNGLSDRVKALEHPSEPPSGDEVTDFICHLARWCHAEGQTDVACRDLWDDCLKREAKGAP